MNTQALRWIVAGGLLVSSQLMAEPLQDLQARLAALRSDQPMRIEVDVELDHRGSAPLHLGSNKKRGMAVVVSGPRGVEVRKRQWLERSSRFSAWRPAKNVESDIPLLDDVDARDLIDPAGTLEFLLSEATLVSDEMVTWQGRPARLLVIQPGQLMGNRDPEASTEDAAGPFVQEAKIWLDESGVPLALERSMEVQLPAATRATAHQTLTFQQVDGHLLVDEARESYSGTALAVLRSRDNKKMKVTAVQ